MAANNVETYTLWIQRCLLCLDDSTSMVFKKKRKGRSRGWQHKGSLSLRRELSYWIFNILQGTKQSYSSLVSGIFLGGTEVQRLTKCVCELLHASKSIACVSRFQQSLGNQSICREIPLTPDVALRKKKGLKRLACIRDCEGPNTMKLC